MIRSRFIPGCSIIFIAAAARAEAQQLPLRSADSPTGEISAETAPPPADPPAPAPLEPSAPPASPALSPPSSVPRSVVPSYRADAASPAGRAPAPDRYSDDGGPPALFGRRLTVGGYGGLDVAYTRMFGRDGALIGLEGAVVLAHRFSIGLAGHGWTNPPPGPSDSFGSPRQFEVGYGGIALRYSVYGSLPVYLTFGGLIGAGAVVLAPAHEDWDDDDAPREDVEREDADVFAVLQPELTVHTNVVRWMRFGLTAGYRFTAGVDRSGHDESDLDAVVVGGHVQFGAF